MKCASVTSNTYTLLIAKYSCTYWIRFRMSLAFHFTMRRLILNIELVSRLRLTLLFLILSTLDEIRYIFYSRCFRNARTSLFEFSWFGMGFDSCFLFLTILAYVTNGLLLFTGLSFICLLLLSATWWFFCSLEIKWNRKDKETAKQVKFIPSLNTRSI